MRYLWPALFLLALLALAFGPGLLRHESAYDEELIILSPHWAGIRTEFGRAFEEKYLAQTGRRIHVTWLDQGAGTSDYVKYVRTKFSVNKDGIGADIFFGGGMAELPGMAKDNYFDASPLPKELEAAIPAQLRGQILRDPNNLFHASCLSAFGFVCNTRAIEQAKLPMPETWADLGRPEFHGWIACGDPSLAGSLHQAFEIVLQSEGWEQGWGTLTRMLSNVRAFAEGGPSVPRDVSMGQAAAGPCIDFYATAPIRRQGGAHLKLVIPKGAAVVTPDGVAILRGAPNKRAAQAFVEFVLGKDGQRLWYQPRGTPGGPKDYDLERLPVQPGIYLSQLPTNTVLDPFSASTASFAYDDAKGGSRWRLMDQLMRAVWVDTHEELWDARTAMLKAGKDAELSAELGKPPMGEKEFLELAKKKMTADEINGLRNSWTAEARRWYGRVGSRK